MGPSWHTQGPRSAEVDLKGYRAAFLLLSARCCLFGRQDVSKLSCSWPTTMADGIPSTVSHNNLTAFSRFFRFILLCSLAGIV